MIEGGFILTNTTVDNTIALSANNIRLSIGTVYFS